MTHTTKWIVGVIVGVLIIVGFVGLKTPDASKTVEPIKIGLSTPVTGEIASYGEALQGGAQLAVSEINAAGGIDGRLLELIVEDDKCTKDAVSAVSKLVNINKVHAVLGPTCSSAAAPSVPIAQGAGVPIMIQATAPELTAIGDYVFRINPSDAFQGKFSAEYMYNELGKRKVAVLYVSNAWGKGIHDVFVKRFTELGGTVVYDESATQEVIDLRSYVAKMKAAEPDAVYLPLYPANGGSVVKTMIELDFRVPILGGDVFDGEEMWSIPEAEGVMFTTASVNNPEDFQQRVKNQTGMLPNTFTPYAYDGVKIFAEVIDRVGTDPEAMKKELRRRTFDGMSNPKISFDEQGDLESAAFVVKVIRSGGAVNL